MRTLVSCPMVYACTQQPNRLNTWQSERQEHVERMTQLEVKVKKAKCRKFCSTQPNHPTYLGRRWNMVRGKCLYWRSMSWKLNVCTKPVWLETVCWHSRYRSRRSIQPGNLVSAPKLLATNQIARNSSVLNFSGGESCQPNHCKM